MAEPFDPSILQTLPGNDATPDADTPMSISEAMTQTRQAFSGLEDLPVEDEGGLLREEDADAAAVAAVNEPSVTPEVPATPTEPVATVPTASEYDALQARLALLEAELIRLNTPAQPQTVPVAPEPPAIPDAVVQQVASRWRTTFDSIQEMREGETEQAFNDRRAAEFASTIIRAVYEDLLPTEAVQSRIRPTIEDISSRTARQVTQEVQQQQTVQQQQATLVRDAVAAARQAGWDVYDPSDPRHGQSKDSRLVWGVATQVSAELSPAQQIAELLSLLPDRQPATAATPGSPPSTPQARPQPMARQGSAPTPATPQADAEAPMTLNDMMRVHARTRRIGVA